MTLSNELFARMHAAAEWHKARGHLEAMLEFSYSEGVSPWEEDTEFERFKKLRARVTDFIEYMDAEMA